jgi:hypothetical protein
MISNETNIICVCCLILLFYFSYQLIYGNPNIFEGMKVKKFKKFKKKNTSKNDETSSDEE